MQCDAVQLRAGKAGVEVIATVDEAALLLPRQPRHFCSHRLAIQLLSLDCPSFHSLKQLGPTVMARRNPWISLHRCCFISASRVRILCWYVQTSLRGAENILLTNVSLKYHAVRTGQALR